MRKHISTTTTQEIILSHSHTKTNELLKDGWDIQSTHITSTDILIWVMIKSITVIDNNK